MEVKKILKEHIDKAKDKACFTCSFQVEDVVILHLLLDIKRDIPVLFIDTGYHFQEVYEFINKLHEEWKFNLKVIKPDRKYKTARWKGNYKTKSARPLDMERGMELYC